MTFHPPTRQRAFTLIETTIVIAFSISMMAALGLLIYDFDKISTYDRTSAQSSGSANAAIREIELFAFPANAVLQTHTFSSATYTSTSTSLVLEIPSVDSSGNIISGTHDYAAFYVVGTTTMYRLLEANAASKRVSGTKRLSSSINTLTFTYNDSNFTNVHTVTVDLQTQARAKQEILNDHRREQIRLRNF